MAFGNTRHALSVPAGQVWDRDFEVTDEVNLGFDEDPPSSGTTASALWYSCWSIRRPRSPAWLATSASPAFCRNAWSDLRKRSMRECRPGRLQPSPPPHPPWAGSARLRKSNPPCGLVPLRRTSPEP
jgi:hypothetical protein